MTWDWKWKWQRKHVGEVLCCVLWRRTAGVGNTVCGWTILLGTEQIMFESHCAMEVGWDIGGRGVMITG